MLVAASRSTPVSPLATPQTTVSIEFDGHVDLTVAEVWPDEAMRPENPTAGDVVRELQRASKESTLRQWNLLPAIEVHVAVLSGTETVSATYDQAWT